MNPSNDLSFVVVFVFPLNEPTAENWKNVPGNQLELNPLVIIIVLLFFGQTMPCATL
jgi:hypothetical protein